MMDVTVKTLDGQNRNYSVPENITVKQFKEKIANSINISAEIQRLIFQGRVMQDDKNMKDYDVHGKVIHVVQRMPPSSTPRPGGGATNASTPPTGGATGEQNLHSTLIGSFINLPSDVADPNQVHSIVQQAVSNMGDMGRNARVTTNASDDGSSVDVHIHLGQFPGARQSESQLRINQARRMLQMARENLDKLDRLVNPPAEEEQQQTERDQEASNSPMDVSESNQAQSTQPTTPTDTTEPSQSQAPVPSETPPQPEAQTPPASRPEPPTTPASSNSQSNPSTENSSGQSTNGRSSDTPRRGPTRPNISIVADVLEEVREVNSRLQPHMDSYQRIVREDRELPGEEARVAQEVCNMVGEILHAISHCYHSLSDLMVDMGEQAPRQLYAAFVPAAIPAAVIQQTIPIHAQINVGGPQVAQRNMSTQSSVPTSSTATSTSQASNNAASQTPSTQASGQSTGTATPAPAPGATPVVTRASTDPYVFLEVGPDNAVTVNSITAHVISSEQEVPNTSGPSTGSTNTAPQGVHVHGHNVTQDLINSIVSSVMHAHTGPRIGPGHVLGVDPNSLRFRRTSIPSSSSATTAQTGSQTTQSSNSSGTQTSTTASGSANTSGTQTSNAPTNTSGTQTGMRAPHAAAFVVPGMPGMMPRFPTAGPASVDPFLPCASRHFLRHQARNNNNTPENQGINAGGIIGEFLNNLAGEVNPHLQGMPHPTTGRTATVTSASGAATSQTGTSSSSSSSSSTSSSTTSTSSTGAGSMPFNPFAGLFGAMGGATPTGINIRMPAGMTIPGMTGMTGMPGMPGMPPGMPFLPGLASMFGQTGPRPPTGSNPSTTSGSTTSTSSTGSNQSTSAPTAGAEPEFVQQLRNLLQTGMGSMPTPAPSASTTGATPTPQAPASTTQGTTQGTAQGTATTQGTGAPPAGATAQPVMTDEAFTQLVQGIGSMITQTAVGQPPSQTLAEFLGSLGDGYNMAQGEGFFNDIYSCLSSHLTFPDLVQVFYGNRAPLQNVRVPLQDFLRERVLEGREPTMENITEASSRLVEEMSEEIEACATVAEVKPDIDLVETLNNFFRQQFTATVRMIMLADESNTNFGNQFYERMRLSLAEMVVLTRSCLVEGHPALQRIIQSRLSAITRGVNPMIQQWMCNVITQQLNQFLPTITITDANVHSYVVKKDTTKQASKTAKKDEAATAVAMETSPPLVSPGASQVDSPEPMETQNNNTGASVAQPPRPPPATAAATKVSATKVKTEEPKADSPGAAAGGGSWEVEVNPEWVPIINSDIEKQKHQRPQPPFSDTYLQGMPAKRRKIMGHEGQVNFSNAEESVPLSLRRAVAAAGVEPISSLENMTSEASDNNELQHAFDEQVLSSIRDRLDSDSDYRPEQFPNTDRYYHKNNNK